MYPAGMTGTRIDLSSLIWARVFGFLIHGGCTILVVTSAEVHVIIPKLVWSGTAVSHLLEKLARVQLYLLSSLP